MLRYIATRFLLWIPSVILVMLAVYALAFYGAGDPIKLIFLRAPGDVAYDPVRVEAIRESAGLTKPFIEQFLNYLWTLVQGNFGNSLSSGRKVWSMIAAAAPVSFQLGLCAIVLTAVVAIPLGLIAGLNQNSKLDYSILGSALFLWAIPPYVAGPLLMVGLLLLLPLAATSWNGAIRRMGSAAWTRLHRLAYPAILAGALHFVMIGKVWTGESLVYLTLTLGLLALRLPIWPRFRAKAA